MECSKGGRPDRDAPWPEFDPTLDRGVSLRISRSFLLVWGLRAGFHLMVRPMVEYLGIATGENSKVITKLSFEARTIEV